jgi:hypothetical protein
MLALTVVYIVLARRSRRATAAAAEANVPAGVADAPAFDGAIAGEGRPVSVVATMTGGQSVALDVGARLAGTGREAWGSQEAAAPARTGPEQGQEILRVIRDAATPEAKAWIKVAGVRYARLSEVRDRLVGERILAAISWALRFSNGRAVSDQGVVTIEMPPCDAVAVPAAFGALADSEEPGELFRLVVDPERSAFWIQVAGRRYGALSEVVDRSVGQTILNGISCLLQFSHGRVYANDGVRVVPVPQLLPVPVADVASSPQRVATPEEEEAFLRQMRRELEEASLRGARHQKKRSRGASGESAAAQERDRSFSLVDEIDGIFQRKLQASPMARTDAQFVARPDGSVRIRVGSHYYDRPEEVPDADLRKIIEAAIAEW